MKLVLFFIFCLFLNCFGATLNLEFLKNSEIKKSICNDGSPGAFWIQKTNSKRWLIHFQGNFGDIYSKVDGGVGTNQRVKQENNNFHI
jgi:hypothetical protein